MKATHKKSALRVHEWVSPDGNVTITPERLRNWRANHQKILASGSSVPMSWDHALTEDGIKVLSNGEYEERLKARLEKKNSAENTIGKLVDLALSNDGNGLELQFDISDPVAAGRADRNEVFISPVIVPEWKLNDGTVLKDVITHVDLVNHPVDGKQGPFEKVEPGFVACALRMGLSTKLYRLAAEDGGDNPFQGGADDDSSSTNKSDSDGGDKESDDKNEAESKGKKGPGIKEMLAALTAMVEMLSTLQEANEKDEEKNDPKKDDEASPASANNDVLTVSDPGFTAMSQTTQKKPAQAAKPADDPRVVALSNDVRAALHFAETEHRRGIASRLDRLLEDGRCTPKEADERRSLVAAVRLSLNDKNEAIASDVERWIESREGCPRGTFWTNARRLSGDVVEPPSRLVDDVTDEEADKIVDRVFNKRAAAK